MNHKNNSWKNHKVSITKNSGRALQKRKCTILAVILAAISFFSYGKAIGVNATTEKVIFPDQSKNFPQNSAEYAFQSELKVKNTVKNNLMILSRAACVVELSSRRVLFEMNGKEKLPMASTTKIVTALAVLKELTHDNDESALNEKFSVPACCCGIEGSSVYLKKGEETTPLELLYGLMLRSGNDCAETLAWRVFGGVKNCALKMNAVAEAAGALHSHFKNPHGLPQNGHYTTARDLSMITALALENSTFAKIVSTRYYKPKNWTNKNKMLAEYEGAIGVKTGFTKQAGRCLVSAAKKEGMTLICTVLNCPDTYGTSRKLLDEAFSSYEYSLLQSAETPIKLNTKQGEITVKTEKDLYYPVIPEEKGYIKRTVIAFDYPQKDENGREICGVLRISLLNSLIFSENLYKL